MNLPPKAPRFALPVGGAKVGSVVRPVADGLVGPIAKPRFGLRSNTRTLASLRPAVTPEGSLAKLDIPLVPDGEVA